MSWLGHRTRIHSRPGRSQPSLSDRIGLEDLPACMSTDSNSKVARPPACPNRIRRIKPAIGTGVEPLIIAIEHFQSRSIYGALP